VSRVAAWYIDGVVRVAIWLALVAACSSKAPPSPEPLVVPHDAGSDAEVVEPDAPAVDGTAPPFGGADSRGHAPAVEPAAEPAAAAAGPPP